MNIAFLLSGLCHAASSHVQSAQTYPLLTLISFAVQGIGIGLQELLVWLLVKRGVGNVKRKTMIFGFVWIWAYFTTPLFLADLAASGAFQLKLLPVSVVGLLLGRRWPGWLRS